MATKVEKRSERRERTNKEITGTVEKKSDTYEESVKTLKTEAPKWGLFLIALLLCWILTKYSA